MTTQNTTARITLDQADEIVLNSQYGEMVDDCEETDDGYVYTLDNGDAVRVTFDGRLVTVEAPNMVSAMTLDEQIAYDQASCSCCGTYGYTEDTCPCEGTGIFPDDED